MISSGKENLKNKLMIITGEVSGDLIGASLIRELKKLDSGLTIFGIGGDKMHEQGMNILYHINKFTIFIYYISSCKFYNKICVKNIIVFNTIKNIC